ncbi:MAG: hypothetical protein J6Z14_07275 [Prevotella sp.]|nr:hypothetical protein [Prevotella sp.]
MTKNRFSLLKTLLAIAVSTLMLSCTEVKTDGNLDLTSQFIDKWNINEDVRHNDDGTITYDALTWGGLVAYFDQDGLSFDMSGYDKLIVDFVEPAEVNCQLMINDDVVAAGSVGITTLECSFLGINVSKVKQVALQAADHAVFKIKRIYLTKTDEEQPQKATTIWEGKCAFGNWENGFVIDADRFNIAMPGDILEIVYTTDPKTPGDNVWRIKTIYSSTEHTLEGNANELDKWGAMTVSRSSTIHHIPLTANDIDSLRVYGLFANGYYTVVTKCNLLQW